MSTTKKRTVKAAAKKSGACGGANINDYSVKDCGCTKEKNCGCKKCDCGSDKNDD